MNAKKLFPIIPALITTGPVMMVLSRNSSGLERLSLVLDHVGTLMLVLGLSWLLVMVMKQQKEIDSLRKELNDTKASH